MKDTTKANTRTVTEAEVDTGTMTETENSLEANRLRAGINRDWIGDRKTSRLT